MNLDWLNRLKCSRNCVRNSFGFRFRWMRRVSNQNRASGAGHGSASLLHRVRQLMRQQMLPLLRRRCVFSRGKINIPSSGIGVCRECVGRIRRAGVRVDADVREICAEARFHEATSAVIERLAGAVGGDYVGRDGCLCARGTGGLPLNYTRLFRFLDGLRAFFLTRLACSSAGALPLNYRRSLQLRYELLGAVITHSLLGASQGEHTELAIGAMTHDGI